MLNYAVDPTLLSRFVPRGVELDSHRGTTYVSVVGFQFLRCRVLGIAIPFHQNFEEVNLRFYVRRKGDDGWRRGVVFVRELVPRRAIAFVARRVYGEPYSALRMRHQVEHNGDRLHIQYGWHREGDWESIAASAQGEPSEADLNSEEAFITEHYWGYTARGRSTSEYQVEHPRWRVWPAEGCQFDADVKTLYGPQFVEPLASKPASAFIAEGSQVCVRTHARITASEGERAKKLSD